MESVAVPRVREAVGRERELTALIRAFDEARGHGQVRLAFVKGPAGIGKTHLFEALKRTLSGRGARIFEGASGRHAARAYGLFAPLVPDLIAYVTELGVPSRTVAGLARRLVPVTGRTPTIGRADAFGARPDERRVDLGDALAELFALAARRTPVILLPDADAADAASLDLLRFAIATLTVPGGGATALLAVSLRDDGPLPAALADLVANAPALSIPLAGLDVEGIRAYLTRQDVAERLLDATGGDPTALEQVLARGVLPSTPRPADLFSRRLQALPAGDADVLRALAVAGSATASDLAPLIAALRGAAPADLPARLDRLERARVLEVASRPAAGADELPHTFARPTDREAALAAILPPERAILDLAAGEERARAGDAEGAARHLLAADPAGRGVAAARAAAELLAARCAYEEAAALLRRALVHAPPAEQRDLHLRLSAVLAAAAEYVPALRHLGVARALSDAASRRELRARAAGLCALLGRPALGIRLCARVLGDQGVRPGDRAAEEASAHRVELTFALGDYDRAEERAREGLGALAHRPDLVLELRNTLGKSELARGRYDAARTVFEENLATARAADDRRAETRAIINLGVVAHRRGDRRAAIASYRAALDTGALDRTLHAMTLANLGSLYADAGEFDKAVDALTRAVANFTRVRRADAAARFALNLASLHLFLGELDRADELCEHARSLAERHGDPYHVATAHLVGGEIAEARGELAAAQGLLAQAGERFEALRSPRFAAEAALALSRVHLSRGETAAARAALARAAVDEMAAGAPAIAAERELLSGEIALFAGDLAESARRLSRAKDLWFEHPDLEGPYRVHYLLSKLRLAASDVAGAEAEVTRAARLVDELASRVPVASRAAFLRIPRRAQVLAAAERGITPSRVATALTLDPAADARDAQPIVGKSAALERVLQVLEAVARANATVLIRGESGTGKELIADAIHRQSTRRDEPFVKVNCAAMVEDLLLSELFGHEKGAFTGAVRERKGRFELADGGSIFLDEIGDISAKCQVALLRVLQEREFERVGGQKTLRVDVRVMCATNRDLETMVARGAFRQDLYYRLRGVMLEMPALRERQEDLPLLCDFFLAKVARDRREPQKTLSPEAMALLRTYPWPGNIRELENMIASVTIFASGSIVGPEAFEHIHEFQARRAALPAAAPASTPTADPSGRDPGASPDYFALARERGLSLKDLRREMESQCILEALREASGNISEAARLLRMKRSRLSQIINGDPTLRSAAGRDEKG